MALMGLVRGCMRSCPAVAMSYGSSAPALPALHALLSPLPRATFSLWELSAADVQRIAAEAAEAARRAAKAYDPDPAPPPSGSAEAADVASDPTLATATELGSGSGAVGAASAPRVPDPTSNPAGSGSGGAAGVHPSGGAHAADAEAPLPMRQSFVSFQGAARGGEELDATVQLSLRRQAAREAGGTGDIAATEAAAGAAAASGVGSKAERSRRASTFSVVGITPPPGAQSASPAGPGGTHLTFSHDSGVLEPGEERTVMVTCHANCGGQHRTTIQCVSPGEGVRDAVACGWVMPQAPGGSCMELAGPCKRCWATATMPTAVAPNVPHTL